MEGNISMVGRGRGEEELKNDARILIIVAGEAVVTNGGDGVGCADHVDVGDLLQRMLAMFELCWRGLRGGKLCTYVIC